MLSDEFLQKCHLENSEKRRHLSIFNLDIKKVIKSLPVLQLSQQLDGLLGMLCADVAPADGASIQQNLKLLEEKLQTVGPCS